MHGIQPGGENLLLRINGYLIHGLGKESDALKAEQDAAAEEALICCQDRGSRQYVVDIRDRPVRCVILGFIWC